MLLRLLHYVVSLVLLYLSRPHCSFMGMMISHDMLLGRWRLSLELFGRVFMEDVGAEPGSVRPCPVIVPRMQDESSRRKLGKPFLSQNFFFSCFLVLYSRFLQSWAVLR